MTKPAVFAQNAAACKRFAVITLVVVLLLAATVIVSHSPVNAGPPPPPRTAASTHTPTTPFTVTDKSVLSAAIHPASGGQVGEPGGSARVTFPPGTVNSPQAVTLTLGVAGGLARRLSLIGPAVRLETDKADERETTQPFTVTLRYTPPQNEGNVVMVWWDWQGGWRLLPTQVNTATQTATALGQHFTAYAVVLQSAGYVLPQRAIVVDDLSSGFVTHGTPANWHIAPPPDGTYYAGQTHWTYSSVSTQDNWATWTSPAPLNGDYLVIAFIPSTCADTQHAQYQIHHNGKVDTVEIDQTQHRSDWTILGLFDFSAGTQSYVSLGDVTGEDGWYIAFDAIAFISANVGPPPGGMVVDDADTGFVPNGPSGYWYAGPPPPAIYYAGQSHWTLNNASVQENWATWTPDTPLDGNYQVWVFVPSYHSNTQSAQYRVYHNGQVDNVEINQSRYLGDWVSLGVFDFTAATAGYVWLSDVTGESAGSRHIAFDAVAFTPNTVYLPVVLKNHPPLIKIKSGIHLGNRSTDWTNEMLQPIDGENSGVFPAAVVVKSEQLYTIWRGGSLCEIGGIDPQPRAPKLFAYLKKAAAAGTSVIIRISPSPGNFQDWNDPVQTNHHLRPDNTPAGGTYCELTPGSGTWGFMKYRALNDIAKEIEQIHNMNKNNGWQEYAFEPANEPNREWYTTTIKNNFVSHPLIDSSVAWQEMNAYFSALYDAVKALPDGSNIRLLTPPMSQSHYAEPVFVQSPGCDSQRLSDADTFGYNEMRTVYETKNDGLSWHSYWTYRHESILPYCGGGDGEHVSMIFPTWMRNQVMYGSKLAFITEADLADPGMQMGSTLIDKDANTANTRDSIRYFFSVEPSPVRPVMWLLNNNFDDLPGEHENADIKWHQAYTPTVGIRPWFTDWWPRSEN